MLTAWSFTAIFVVPAGTDPSASGTVFITVLGSA